MKNVSQNNFTQILKYVKEEKYRLTGAVGLLLISSGVTLTVPLLVGKIIDYISTGKKPNETFIKILNFFDIKSYKIDKLNENFELNKENIKKFGGIALGFFIIGGLANFGRFYLIQTAGQRIILRLRNRLYSSLVYKPVEFYDKNQSGELISRISSDTDVVGQGLSNNISNGLRSGLQAILGISMMVYVSPNLSLFSLFILPPIMGTALIFGKYIRNISNNLQQSVALSTEKANESLSAIRTVKAFCKEAQEIINYQNITSNVLVNANREALLRGSFFGLMGMSGNILVVSLLFYGGSLISAGQLTIGDLSSFLLYAGYATVSVGGIGTFYTDLMKTVGAGSRLWQWMDDPSEKAILFNQNFLSNPNIALSDIKFENVFFAYPTRPDHLIFDDFSLHIPKGKITAIVGSSGCGKSSIVSLLLKFYDIDSGKLLIGDKPLAEIENNLWKQKIAAVLQDPVLFSCSIAENIAYGIKSDFDSNFKIADIEKVAKLSRVMEFASKLPDGLNTKIGDRGTLLSGGQRQRIAIARALISDPDIVIFDEAMSALDNENEILVQKAINDIFYGRTILTISHRLSLLRSAFQIAVINKGKVVELGSFDKLLNNNNNIKRGTLFQKLLSNTMI